MFLIMFSEGEDKYTDTAPAARSYLLAKGYSPLQPLGSEWRHNNGQSALIYRLELVVTVLRDGGKGEGGDRESRNLTDYV